MKKANFKIALFEPRIPQNTGNIARTCAAFSVELNLIQPLGFSIEDKYLKRAGLDYWNFVSLNTHKNFKEFKYYAKGSRIIALSKYSKNDIGKFGFQSEDILLFGREDTGLPENVRNTCSDILSIPMPNKADENGKNGVRSLNLSVACAIAIYTYGKSLTLW